jgi:hypothetical protein
LASLRDAKIPPFAKHSSKGRFNTPPGSRGLHFVCKFDEIVKSPLAVIPDLIRDPEVVEKTGFRPSPE